MNNESIKDELIVEGFAHVYEWTDEPNTEYLEHAHKGRVSFYITKGSILMILDGVHTIIRQGDRFDVPIGIPHTAKVGDDGCTFIVGEEIEGDS